MPHRPSLEWAYAPMLIFLVILCTGAKRSGCAHFMVRPRVIPNFQGTRQGDHGMPKYVVAIAVLASMISFAPLVEAKEFYVVWSRKDNACDVTAKKPADQSRVLGTYPTKEQAEAEQDKMPKCRQPKAQ
jgi:hypothetical protein